MTKVNRIRTLRLLAAGALNELRRPMPRDIGRIGPVENNHARRQRVRIHMIGRGAEPIAEINDHISGRLLETDGSPAFDQIVEDVLE